MVVYLELVGGVRSREQRLGVTHIVFLDFDDCRLNICFVLLLYITKCMIAQWFIDCEFGRFAICMNVYTVY